jgi:TRAP-type C4-dicarboxylate transport system substrate-binding protein
MAQEWQDGTEGRVKLRVYPGGVAGDDPDVVRKMRIGQLQGAALTISGLSQIDEAFNVFSIPLFYGSDEEFLCVREQLTGACAKRLEERGFHFLGWGHAGWVHIFTVPKVVTVSDLKKVKIFTWAGDDRMSQVWKATGYNPVPLAATDILTGLQTGLIDGIPTTPYAALALQWFRHTPHMLDVRLAPLLGATVLSNKAWEQIDPGDRAFLEEAGRRMEKKVTAEIAVGDGEAITEMTKRGLTVVDIDESSGEWKETATLFTREMRRLLVPQEIFDLALRHRDEFRSRSGSGAPR